MRDRFVLQLIIFDNVNVALFKSDYNNLAVIKEPVNFVENILASSHLIIYI